MNEQPKGPILKIVISRPIDRDGVEIRLMKYEKINDSWRLFLLAPDGTWTATQSFEMLPACFFISGRDLIRWDAEKHLRGEFMSDGSDVPSDRDVVLWLGKAIQDAGVTNVEFML